MSLPLGLLQVVSTWYLAAAEDVESAAAFCETAVPQGSKRLETPVD